MQATKGAADSAAPSPTEVAWAAGLFEGEGNFHVNAERKTAKAGLSSTDEDAVRRFAEIVGVGKVYGPYFYPENRMMKKERWDWITWKTADTQAVFDLLSSWLCARRRAKGQLVLETATK